MLPIHLDDCSSAWSRDWQTIASSGQTLNILGFSGHVASFPSELCYYCMILTIVHKWYIKSTLFANTRGMLREAHAALVLCLLNLLISLTRVARVYLHQFISSFHFHDHVCLRQSQGELRQNLCAWGAEVQQIHRWESSEPEHGLVGLFCVFAARLSFLEEMLIPSLPRPLSDSSGHSHNSYEAPRLHLADRQLPGLTVIAFYFHILRSNCNKTQSGPSYSSNTH